MGGSMKKIILVDGNNLLFRSYYATAYTGNLMTNHEGIEQLRMVYLLSVKTIKVILNVKPNLYSVAPLKA